MKNLLLLVTLIILSFEAKADQLAFLSKTQAEQAVELLKEQKELVLWCACCPDEQMKRVSVKNVSIRYTDVEDFYTVVLDAIDSNGNITSEELDLAYVHFKIGNKAYNVGHILGFNCDPCTQPFKLD
jgi:hypothetical protein